MGQAHAKSGWTRDAYAAAYKWAKSTHNLNIAFVSAWSTKMKYIYIYIYISNVAWARPTEKPVHIKKKASVGQWPTHKGKKKNNLFCFLASLHVNSQATCKE